MISGNKKKQIQANYYTSENNRSNNSTAGASPSDENLQISKPAISLELRQTKLEQQLKKQNELIEKLTKIVNTFEDHMKVF